MIRADHYLQFDSNHRLAHKPGVIRTLNYRTNTVESEPADVKQELANTRRALTKCGYPD